MLMGRIRALGAFFIKTFSPMVLKGLGTPVRLRVPSGKITALLLVSSIWLPSFWSSEMACLGSFLSIRAEPPCLRLKETEGMPRPNSFLLTNFGWYLRIYQMIGGMSNMLWWLVTMIKGLPWGISTLLTKL